MKHEYEEILIRLKRNDASLRVLDFRQQNLTSQESLNIFQALEANTRVIELQFLGNISSGEAARALGSMLKINETIEHLYLGSNELNDEDIIHIMNGIKDNTSVVQLDLNSNPFSSAEPIAHLLEHHQHLQEIDLTNSNISEAGFSRILAALERNEHSALTAFNVYFPSISMMDDFVRVCHDNASRGCVGLGL